MPSTGYRHGIITPGDDTDFAQKLRAVCGWFDCRYKQSHRSYIVSEHAAIEGRDYHVHVVWFESSNSNGLSHYIRNELGLGFRTRRLFCYDHTNAYLHSGRRHVVQERVGREGSGRAPSCGGEDHGSDSDASWTPACRNRELPCFIGSDERDLSESDEGITRSTQENQEDGSKRNNKRLRFPGPAKLIQTLDEVVQEIYPESVAQVSVRLTQIGNSFFTHHRDYEKYCNTCIRNHRLSFIGKSWVDILRENADYTYPRENFLSVDDSLHYFEIILNHNKINKEKFVRETFNVCNKLLPKRNTLCLIGAPNAGKTLIADSIVKSFIYYGSMQQMNGLSAFEFSPAMHQRIVLVNEPRITDKTIELFKNILEGHPVSIDEKFKAPQVLERTPIIIAGNNYLVLFTTQRELNLAAVQARTYWYELNPCSELKECQAGFNPRMWLSLLAEFNL